MMKCLWIAVVFLASVVPAAETDPWPAMELDMKTIQANMKNLSVRLKYVAGQVGGPGAIQRRERVQQQQPVRACCGANIAAIEASTKEMLESLRILTAEHDAAGDTAGSDSLAHVAKTLRGYYRAFRLVIDAREPQGAEVSMKTAVREFNHLQRALAEYDECCRVKPKAEKESDAKSGKKKKKKKKQEASKDGA
jgi:hypothetical protein